MQTVLILGAASDIAIAIARKFASEKYAIQLAARNVERLVPLQKDLSIRSNTDCTLHEFDALNFSSHTSFFDNLEVKPSITICVFGYLGEQEKAMVDWEECKKIIDSNYTGAVSVLNIISNYYVTQHKGVIAGISSVAGERGRQSNYLYGSAKAAFSAYLSGLRNRMLPHQVHVASIQPGFVYTRMTEHLKLPALLTAKPEDVGAAVYKAVVNKKDIVYVKWFWFWIMMIIKSIPEFIFKKMKL